jgi:hypothetical protein
MPFWSQRTEIKIIHHAHVFISKTDEVVIFATLHFNGIGGFLYEDRTPVVLPPPLDPEVIGQTALTVLHQTTIKKQNLEKRPKLTDWPAFKASKMASVRQFEQSFIPILIKGANESNLVYVIEGVPSMDSELNVTSSISSSAESILLGMRILSVYRACRDRWI